MSALSIYDYRGFVGEWEPVTLVDSVCEYLIKQGDIDLLKFAENGYYNDPAYLTEKLKGLKPPEELKQAVDELITLAGKCEDVVIISDADLVSD